MALQHLVQTPLAKALGWTFFHSLWEGAVAAIALALVLSITRSARTRYVLGCVAMLSILAGFIFTLLRVMPDASGASAITPDIGLAPAGQSSGRLFVPLRIADALPWLSPFWIAGVIFFQLRNVGSWMSARRLRRRGVCAAPESWQLRLKDLGKRVGATRPVSLLESCFAEVPVVMGYMRR